MNGALIRERRKALGLTQEQLAEILGVTQGSVGQMEAGIRGKSPRLSTLRRLAAALEVSLEALIGDEPAPPDPEPTPEARLVGQAA